MSLRDFFPQFGDKNLAEDINRIYDCFAELRKQRWRLETEMLPMPEAGKIHGRQGLKNDVETWSFSMLLSDKLQEKGWNVMPQQGQDHVLTNLLHILDIQSEGKSGRTNLKLILKQDGKPGHPRAPTIAFLREHLNDLEQVAEEIKQAVPEDIKGCHKMVYTGQARPIKIAFIKKQR